MRSLLKPSASSATPHSSPRCSPHSPPESCCCSSATTDRQRPSCSCGSPNHLVCAAALQRQHPAVRRSHRISNPRRTRHHQVRRTARRHLDAEVAFFDEIGRCRPEVANKLFPIIHERTHPGRRNRTAAISLGPPPIRQPKRRTKTPLRATMASSHSTPRWLIVSRTSSRYRGLPISPTRTDCRSSVAQATSPNRAP